MVVTPASSSQAALPEGALSNPNEALNPKRYSKPGRPRGSSKPLEQQQEQQQQQLDPQMQQLLTQFQPFMQALQKIARQKQQQQQQQQGLRKQQKQQDRPAEADMQWRSSSSGATLPPAELPTGLQQQREEHIKAPGRTSRLLELFGVPEQVAAASEEGAGTAAAAGSGMSAVRISRDAADALSAQPSQAKQAAQRLAQMIMQQQQARKQQQAQQATGDTQEEAEQAAEQAADAEAEAESADADTAPGQLLSSAVPAAGTTRIYLPAPPLTQASSAAERQPLRLLSIRQQEQLRKEARAEAIRKVCYLANDDGHHNRVWQ
jgi:hypothetical protein